MTCPLYYFIFKVYINNYKFKIDIPSKRTYFEIVEPKIFENSYPSIKIPYNEITQIRGPSGSGKSGVIVKTLANTLYKQIHKDYLYADIGIYKNIKLLKQE